jgi:uncharacterized protein (DUF362 family)
MVPKKLYELRGFTFVSFAKLKRYATFTIKNLFGMIPEPCKPWWHGKNNSRIATNIVDLYKTYSSLFNVYSLFEALDSTGFPHPKGIFEGIYGGKYNIVKGLGVLAFGKDLVSLDSILLQLTESWINIVEKINRRSIELAELEGLGIIDREACKVAKIKVKDWLSPPSF